MWHNCYMHVYVEMVTPKMFILPSIFSILAHYLLYSSIVLPLWVHQGTDYQVPRSLNNK
jgi:hypothetical protein